MPGVDVALEAQIWPVMESLARAAVAEICRVIESECVEMRLEIRRGQTEIESLKGKLRDLKKSSRNTGLAALPPTQPPSLDNDFGEREKDMRADDLQHGSQSEEEVKISSPRLSRSSLQGEKLRNQGSPNSSLNCRNEQTQSVFSSSGNGLEFRLSQIHSDSLTTEDKADTGGLGTAAVKVESDSYSEPVFDGFQAYQKLGAQAKGQMTGGINSRFGTADDFQPRNSEEASHCEYDSMFSHLNEQRNGEGSHCIVKCKTEPEEEPIAKRANESALCEMADSDALPWPFFGTVNYETQDCASKLQEILHTHTDTQLFHFTGPSEVLPSCSIKHAADPRVKQAKARKIQDRIQARTFKQNTGSWSAILTKVKNLPKTNKHKPLPCSFCPKSFYNASDLKRHQRIHTGEKPFGCAVCGKRFALRGNLITHERAHSGTKPFTCQQCGKSFAHGSNLTAHQRVHTGEKPFCCSQCGKTFAWHFPFKRHMNLHGQLGPTP